MSTPEVPQHQQLPDDDPPPPMFSSWKQMYAFVLILHAIIIALFYIFTETYS